MQEISETNIRAYHQDMDALGIMRADEMPRATECLNEIRSLIKNLEEKGAAYSVDGDVYFAVMKQASYGKLSGRDLEKQQLNADGRLLEVEETRTQNSFDFALWKAAKEGEPYFPSPWGTPPPAPTSPAPTPPAWPRRTSPGCAAGPQP